MSHATTHDMPTTADRKDDIFKHDIFIIFLYPQNQTVTNGIFN